MTRGSALFLSGGMTGAALLLMAMEQPPTLAAARPGLWEIEGAPGTHQPVRQCIADVPSLARFEHRASNCVVKDARSSMTGTRVDYVCGRAGFGHSEIDVITPRALRISTQGISGGLPFNYVLQARRIGECTKTASTTHH